MHPYLIDLPLPRNVNRIIHYFFQGIGFLCQSVLSFNKNSSQNKIVQRQPPRGVTRKMCSEKMQQISRRTTMPSVISIKLLCNFIEIVLRHKCYPVNLLHIFRTYFLKNTSGWLLLIVNNA